MFYTIAFVISLLTIAVNTSQPESWYSWGQSCQLTRANRWFSTAPIPHYRQEHSVTAIGDYVYVLGGILPFDGTTYPTVSLVERYSICNDSWSTVASMPVALNHVNIAAVGGKIYALGGLAVTATGGPAFWNASSSCSVYDPDTDTWTVLPDMPDSRAIGSAATDVKGTVIYLAGGLKYTNLTNDDEGTTDIFTAYDTAAQTWTELPPMPAPRDHAGRGLVGNKLYVLGGRSFGHNNTVDTTFEYDIDTQSWSSSLQHMPSSRGGCASATIGELIYTVGGEGNPTSGSMGVFSQNEAYNTTSDTWIEFAPMDVPRHGTAAVAVNDRVYVPGGGLMIGGGPTFFANYYQP